MELSRKVRDKENNPRVTGICMVLKAMGVDENSEQVNIKKG